MILIFVLIHVHLILLLVLSMKLLVLYQYLMFFCPSTFIIVSFAFDYHFPSTFDIIFLDLKLVKGHTQNVTFWNLMVNKWKRNKGGQTC
jgi:hypothetical protein